MERLKNKSARRYLRTVRGLLPCSRKMKAEITEPLRRSLVEFLTEQPNAVTDDIRERFGEPEIIAASCLEEVETSELLCKLRIRRKVVAIVVAAVFLILTSWTAYIIYTENKVNSYLYGSDVTEPVEIEYLETYAETDAETSTP